ncbi:MAG: ROK family protein [Solobacterium sp.]|nr:ROK family protein [Solobacterium sp.]
MRQELEKFKEWILQQVSDRYTIREEGSRIFFTTKYAEACIRFHDLDIIEYTITRTEDQEIVFYLHFQFNDPAHAMYLFEQLRESLLSTGKVRRSRIMLICSSALTTSFFAQKMNQSSELLNLFYDFNAVSCSLAKDVGHTYDIILLAPQVAFMKDDFRNRFPGKPVVDIPARIFGSYDVKGLIQLVSSCLTENNNLAPSEKSYILYSSHKIMAITTRIDGKFKISYRVFFQGRIIRSETIIKDTIDYHDFEDILDIVSLYEKDLDTVVLSVPGVVHNGAVILENSNFREHNMKDRLSAKYPYRFIVTNNANSTALGLYHRQNEYKSVVYHSQLKAGDKAGQGIVINGMVVTGKNGIAGEVNFLLENINDTRDSTPIKAARAVANAIISDIAVIGPEAVYIRCELIHDTKKVREFIREKVSDKYIPDLFILDHATEYMFYGAQMMAMEGD